MGARENAERTLYHVAVAPRNQSGVDIVMEGDGFLQHMCRIIAGTLVTIGCGAWEPARIDTILQTKRRSAAGPTLPAEGLCLEHLEQDGKWSKALSDSIPVATKAPLGGEWWTC